ncbi:MAG: T9SS type A sorting domain-containing protein [Balneolaceae bacterium]
MTNTTTTTTKISKMLSRYFFWSASIAIVLMATSNFAYAQRTVNVESGPGTLNEAIASDTTDTGARIDSNTVYVLERDGFYLLEGTIQNRGYHLSIVAEDGEGERPQLVPAVGDGGVSGRPFRPRGDLTLRGLYVTGEDEEGALNGDLRIIRVSENNVRIIIDDCHLDKDGQAAFRIDNAGNRLFITNSIISNIGTTASPDNGRVIDDRGSQIDTLVMENNSFYNITSNVVKDFGGEINYARINHNTAVNIGKNGAYQLGTVLDLVFTNNLIIDGAFYGRPANENEASPLSVVEVDSLTPTQLDSLGAPSIEISNNNIYRSAALSDAYPDTVVEATFYNPTSAAYIAEAGTGDTNISEEVEFTAGPATPVEVVTSFYSSPGATQPDMPTDGEPFDFGYANTFDSYTAGTNGQQLGSLIWHGGMTVGIDDEIAVNSPESFELHGNYPNPFNPTTNVSFNLPQAAQVSVDVFSVIGQKVLSVPAQQMTSGANQHIMIDASALTSGMYIYRVTAKTANNTMINTGRMTLIK